MCPVHSIELEYEGASRTYAIGAIERGAHDGVIAQDVHRMTEI